MSALAGPVGWIGTGKMGAPMATHLAWASYALQVHDANPASLAGLLTEGMAAATDIESLGRACGVVFTCIPDDPALVSVV